MDSEAAPVFRFASYGEKSYDVSLYGKRHTGMKNENHSASPVGLIWIRLIGIIVCVFAIPNNAAFAEKSTPEWIERSVGATSLCIGRDANGYNWRNGEWVRAGFVPQKYIIKKVPIPADLTGLVDGVVNLCLPEDGFPDVGLLKRCYRVYRLGEKPFRQSMCYEHYMDDKLAISCELDGFYFRPSGSFIKKTTAADLDSHDDYKDSMYIEHGKCSDI